MPCRSFLLVLAATFVSSNAAAQNLDPQHFHPSATMTGLVTVKGGAAETGWDSTLSLTTIWMHEPLTVVDLDGNRIGPLVGDRFDAVISYALGFDLTPLNEAIGAEFGFDAAVVVPFVPVMHQAASLKDGIYTENPREMGGLADPRLELRISLPTAEYLAGIHIAIIPVISFPLAIGGRYMGSETVVFTPELAASAQWGPVIAAINLGFRVRGENDVKGLPIENELTWRAGAGLDIDWLGGPKGLLATVEAYGLTRSTEPFQNLSETPLELVGAVRYRMFHLGLEDFVITGGGGGGLTSGYGAPSARAFLAFAWAPRTFDLDGDGINDDVDACPEIPEDIDSFEDGDGCPEEDNDQDGLKDDDDACPNRPEDKDEFEDDDGCPDDDNDKDGVRDVDDRCPLEPEDVDGFEDENGCPDTDNDGDQILDTRDKCPNDPEDVDDFQDTDGCPDEDNDGDGFPDTEDACPMQPEDLNGHKDDDGCPDAKDDRDGDGIKDKDDGCPTEPEDKDGFEDEDGCPDLDNDQDGVPDAKDYCPLHPEDMDGFMDEDGCPEEDNDGDGILDAADPCPNEAETINGFEDDDGCPDEGAQLVRLTAEKIEIGEKVYFDSGSAKIQERSFNLLDQVAAVLKNHITVRKLRIEGHTDDRGAEQFNLSLSQRRAESVRDYLEDKGIEAERLEATGFGESRAIATNRTAKGREVNRRVEFLVAEQSNVAPEEPAPETPPAPAAPDAPESGAAPTPTPTTETGARDPAFFYHQLQTSESLADLATSLWKSPLHADLLLTHNPGPKSIAEKMKTGAVVKIPRQIKYTVARGDTLGAIAERFLGNVRRYKEIAAASTDVLPDPSKMDVGMELTIPLVHRRVEKLLTPAP